MSPETINLLDIGGGGGINSGFTSLTSLLTTMILKKRVKLI